MKKVVLIVGASFVLSTTTVLASGSPRMASAREHYAVEFPAHPKLGKGFLSRIFAEIKSRIIRRPQIPERVQRSVTTQDKYGFLLNGDVLQLVADRVQGPNDMAAFARVSHSANVRIQARLNQVKELYLAPILKMEDEQLTVVKNRLNGEELQLFLNFIADGPVHRISDPRRRVPLFFLSAVLPALPANQGGPYYLFDQVEAACKERGGMAPTQEQWLAIGRAMGNPNNGSNIYTYYINESIPGMYEPNRDRNWFWSSQWFWPSEGPSAPRAWVFRAYQGYVGATDVQNRGLARCATVCSLTWGRD